jgi:hypothetical protein
MYAVVTLAAEHLEEVAAQHGLVLDPTTLGGTGIDTNRRFSPLDLSRLRLQFERIHAGHLSDAASARMIGTRLLDDLILHFARPPRFQLGGTDPRGLARIVARARAFIHENLDQPLSIHKIANAARDLAPDAASRIPHRAR